METSEAKVNFIYCTLCSIFIPGDGDVIYYYLKFVVVVFKNLFVQSGIKYGKNFCSGLLIFL